MNQIIKLVLVSLFLFPVLALSEPTSKDITNEMEKGNTKLAEELTRDVIHNHPESAKAHYYLGQILTKEGKYQEAYNELNKAANLDKSLSFASSDAKFRQEMRKVEINIGKIDAPNASNETHLGKYMIVLFGLICLVGGGIYLVILAYNKKEQREKERLQQDKIKEQTNKLVGLLDKVSSLEMTVKVSDLDEEYKKTKLAALSTIKDDLNDFLLRNKKQNELIPYTSIGRIEKSIRQIETNDPVKYVQNVTNKTEEEPKRGATILGKVNRPTVSQDDTLYGSNNTASIPPQPTVVNNYTNTGSSNSGFIEGMLIGDMIGGRNNNTTTIIERDREVETTNTRNEDRDEEENRRNTIDSSDRNDFDSGNNEDSFDSGGSDSSVDSSSDSDW